MRKKGKKYVQALELVEKGKVYTKEEAIELVKKTSTSKFDGTVEVAINLNLDTKKTDQQLRGALVLPNGTGKTKTVLVLTKNAEQTKAAKEAGADFVGEADLVEKIQNENWLDFDVIIATPEMMPLLGRLGKVLGPRGLMPNPKIGTVTTEMEKTIVEFKKGRLEYRTDTYGNIHMCVGKVSSKPNEIVENIEAIIAMLKAKKPSTVKGQYIQNISVSPTMGPGVKVTISNN